MKADKKKLSRKQEIEKELAWWIQQAKYHLERADFCRRVVDERHKWLKEEIND